MLHVAAAGTGHQRRLPSTFLAFAFKLRALSDDVDDICLLFLGLVFSLSFGGSSCADGRLVAVDPVRLLRNRCCRAVLSGEVAASRRAMGLALPPPLSIWSI